MKTLDTCIMLIDDNQECLISMRECLKMYGHTVLTFDRAHKALHILETLAPDIILLDLGMPEMSGQEFMLAYKGDVPIVVVTAWDDPQLPYPPAAVVTKPVNMKSLDCLVREIIQPRRMLKTAEQMQ